MSDLSDNRTPLTRAAELDALDEAEMTEGYFDGFLNEPCGDNRSRSHWHGHRNGMVDGGHAKGDSAQATLAHDYVHRSKGDELDRQFVDRAPRPPPQALGQPMPT